MTAAALLGALLAAAHCSKLTPLAGHGIRVQIMPTCGTMDPPISAINATGTGSHSDSNNTVTNGNLRVTVDSTGVITATRLSDQVVVLQTSLLHFGDPAPNATAGLHSLNVTFKTPVDANERVYGFGEHYGKGVNMMPYYKDFADSMCYSKSHGADVSIPWYFSTAGYGFVWNSPSLGSVNVTSGKVEWTSLATYGLDFWVTTTSGNPTMSTMFAELLQHYVDVVGHPTPMPYYASGFIQSKDRYRNQTQLMSVAREYVQRDLPISVIVIDWQHWVHQGDWSLNPTCWPNPQAMADELKELGIELMITMWPMVVEASDHWNEFNNSNYFAISTATGKAEIYDDPNPWYLVDATNPAAMKAVFNAWWEGYGKYGVRSIWLDATEPEHMNPHTPGQWQFHAGSNSEMLTGWIQKWTGGFSEGLQEKGYKPGEFFMLARSSWAGVPNNGAATWSGDIASDWPTFQKSVVVAQQTGLSGITLWTTDIGGYFSGNLSSPSFQELIVRWFQFGAFCPLFRLHGHRDGGPPQNQCGPTNGDNEVWNLARDQEHYDAITAVMKLREQLRPYVMRINEIAITTGFPMLRPMFLEFPTDRNLTSYDGQFMFGPDWLVSPVTQAGAKSWKVYIPELPQSEEWIYWWDQKVVTVRGEYQVPLSGIGTFPLFFRRPVQ